MDEAEGEEDQAERVGEKRRASRKGVHAAIENAVAFQAKTELSYSWEGNLDSAGRLHEFGHLIQRMNACARKAGQIVGNKDAAAASENLFILVELLEGRQALFKSIRGEDSVRFVVRDLTDQELSHVREAPMNTLATIMQQTAHHFMERIYSGDDYTEALCCMLVFDQGPEFTRFTTGLLKSTRAAEGCKSLPTVVADLQKNLVWSLADKLWKSTDRALVVHTIAHLWITQ